MLLVNVLLATMVELLYGIVHATIKQHSGSEEEYEAFNEQRRASMLVCQ